MERRGSIGDAMFPAWLPTPVITTPASAYNGCGATPSKQSKRLDDGQNEVMRSIAVTRPPFSVLARLLVLVCALCLLGYVCWTSTSAYVGTSSAFIPTSRATAASSLLLSPDANASDWIYNGRKATVPFVCRGNNGSRIIHKTECLKPADLEAEPFHWVYNSTEYRDLITLLKTFAVFAKGVGLEWVMAYSTLLGSVRHADVIPWDKRSDIAVFEDQWPSMVQVISSVHSGLRVDEGQGRLTVVAGTASVEVSMYRRKSDAVLFMHKDRSEDVVVSVTTGEFLPISSRPFGPLSLPSPRLWLDVVEAMITGRKSKKSLNKARLEGSVPRSWRPLELNGQRSYERVSNVAELMPIVKEGGTWSTEDQSGHQAALAVVQLFDPISICVPPPYERHGIFAAGKSSVVGNVSHAQSCAFLSSSFPFVDEVEEISQSLAGGGDDEEEEELHEIVRMSNETVVELTVFRSREGDNRLCKEVHTARLRPMVCYKGEVPKVDTHFKWEWSEEIYMDGMKLMEGVDQVFTTLSLHSWWMGYSSLLGSVRHADVVPWIVKYDLFIAEEEWTDFLNFHAAVVKDGPLPEDSIGRPNSTARAVASTLRLTRLGRRHAGKLSLRDATPAVGGLQWNLPFVDVWIFGRKSDESFELDQGIEVGREDLFPTHRRLLGPLWLPVPRRPLVVLDSLYGSEWRTQCSTGHYDYQRETSVASLPDGEAPQLPCSSLFARFPFVTSRTVKSDGRWGRDGAEEVVRIGNLEALKVAIDAGEYFFSEVATSGGRGSSEKTEEAEFGTSLLEVAEAAPASSAFLQRHAKREGLPLNVLKYQSNLNPPPSRCAHSDGSPMHRTLCFRLNSTEGGMGKFKWAWNITEYEISTYTMRRLDQLMGVYDIPYVMSYGTLLGSMRHGDVIPWDDDVDISIDVKDYERLKAAARDDGSFDLHNAGRDGKWWLGKIFLKSNPKQGYYSWTLPAIDVWGYIPDKPNGVVKFREYDDFSVDYDTLFPFHRRPFGSLLLPAPNRPDQFLRETMNKRVLEDCDSGYWNHTSEESRPGSKQIECVVLQQWYPFVVQRTSLKWNSTKDAYGSIKGGAREIISVDGEVFADYVVFGGEYSEFKMKGWQEKKKEPSR